MLKNGLYWVPVSSGFRGSWSGDPADPQGERRMETASDAGRCLKPRVGSTRCLTYVTLSPEGERVLVGRAKGKEAARGELGPRQVLFCKTWRLRLWPSHTHGP